MYIKIWFVTFILLFIYLTITVNVPNTMLIAVIVLVAKLMTIAVMLSNTVLIKTKK